jgi:hypothetical protein
MIPSKKLKEDSVVDLCPIWSVPYENRNFEHSQRNSCCTCIEEKPERKQPFASQGESLRRHQIPKQLHLGLSAFRAVRE